MQTGQLISCIASEILPYTVGEKMYGSKTFMFLNTGTLSSQQNTLNLSHCYVMNCS